MDMWLRELRSPVGEGPVRGGERQARAAIRLVSRDPTIKRVMLVEALLLTGLWIVFFLLNRVTRASGRDAGQVFADWVYWVIASGVATFGSVAIACAAAARIDGVEVDLGSALEDVRRRLPTVLCWWVVSMGCVIGLGCGTAAVMRPLPAVLVIAAVWGLGSLFVVPAIVLGSGGPPATLGEALRLLRARWGRALAGLFVIGFLGGLLFIAAGFLLVVLARGHHRTAGEWLWRFSGPLFLLYCAYVLVAGTREGFGVIIARDALDDLPGETPAAIPRRRWTRIVGRVVLGAVGLMITLFVIGTLFVHPYSSHHSSTPPTRVPSAPVSHPITFSAASFATPIREPAARRLQPGAPVVLRGKTIGRVSMVHIERAPLIEVFFETDPRRESIVIHSLKKVATRNGKVYLVIAPKRS